MRVAVSVVLAFLAIARSVGGQPCLVPKESNEAKLLAFFAAPIAFSPAGNLTAMSAGDVRLSFDATYVPRASDELQETSRCFAQKKENTRLSPVFPRPRLAVGLGGGVFVEASYLPPVTLMDAEPNLGSVALGVVRPVANGMMVALRAHSTFGRVTGPITCPSSAIQQQAPADVCFGTSASKDTYRPNLTGVEGAVGWTRPHWSGYAGAGYSSLDPRFQVGFQPSNDDFDDTKVQPESRLARFTAMVGGRYQVASRAALTGEIYSVPKDVTTFRIGASYELRGERH